MAKKTGQTFLQVWKGLIDVLAASYKLAPCLVIVMALLIAGVTAIVVLSTKAMVATVLLLVLGATIVVYATTHQFGEATLALVAGILTAYGVQWTPNRFIGFVAVWATFCFVALMIASIKIASASESIYRQAAIAYAPSLEERQAIEKQLKAIGDDKQIEGIGPIERAEVLRQFSYRKIPIEVMPVALKACAMLTVITQIDHLEMGKFIADVFKVFDFVDQELQSKIIELVFQAIQTSAVPPADFISGFEHSRHLILSRAIGPVEFLAALNLALQAGTPPNDCAQVISASVNTQEK
ncbi:MAG: hypothetical protein SVX28_12360 [Pseudomonadota bacterium]|nr:hypothetical protein [Pseudomonadota bacterium]